jgi:hypothetical protein
LILGGVLLDVTVGACLLLWPRPRVYVAALVAVGLLSVLATVMTPSAWLHPYGPLLKNLPLMASLVWAWQVDGDVDGGAR